MHTVLTPRIFRIITTKKNTRMICPWLISTISCVLHKSEVSLLLSHNNQSQGPSQYKTGTPRSIELLHLRMTPCRHVSDTCGVAVIIAEGVEESRHSCQGFGIPCLIIVRREPIHLRHVCNTHVAHKISSPPIPCCAHVGQLGFTCTHGRGAVMLQVLQ